MTDPGAVLLTGATGFVGMELLARYLEAGQREVYTLVRADDDRDAERRVGLVLANLFGSRACEFVGRVRAVAGDLTVPGLGLEESCRRHLAERVRTVVHSAASVSFTQELAEARQTNVEGTRAMLAFAADAERHGGLDLYAHVSTAYVAGTHRGVFRERDLDVSQRFHNAYEQSKFEAEHLVRGDTGLRSLVARPSIVVGDRHSGWTAAFNVLYWPLRAFARGLFTAVPADPAAPVDAVSVDYVADALYALCESADATGGTYHLTAGTAASTVGEVAALASRYFDRPVPEVLPPSDAARSAAGPSLADGRVFLPYFAMGARFDDSRARSRLVPLGITATPLREYLDQLLDFATRSRWGKRPIARVEALLNIAAVRL